MGRDLNAPMVERGPGTPGQAPRNTQHPNSIPAVLWKIPPISASSAPPTLRLTLSACSRALTMGVKTNSGLAMPPVLRCSSQVKKLWRR